MTCDSMRRRTASALALASVAPSLWAQRKNPLRVIVGVPPGSTTDVVTRIVADALGSILDQPVVVENRPGGMGTIASTAFLAAPRDGQTWLFAVNGFFSEAPYSVKMRFDPLKDVKPLVEVGINGGLVLVGDADLPPKTLKELVEWVKARKGKVSYASYSAGSLSHVLGLLLNRAEGLDMLHVPYKGSPPALQDIMAHQVQFMFDAPATSLPLIRSGKLRAFAVTSAERIAQLPDVPTLAELGYRGMTRTAWLAVWTTPDVPSEAQQHMRAATLAALAQPGVRQRLAEVAINVETRNPATPEELARRLQADHAAIGETLRSIGYQPE